MATLAGLGAFHGANPAMGWLFAVALGMQERRRAALWRAMLPLGLGHALAVGAAIAVALAMGVMLTPQMMRWPMAALLAGMGLYRLFRHCRARYCGMKVGMAGLTAWSFLMASAHGAGLMVVPVFLGMAAPVDGASCHAAAPDAMTGVVATLVHGAGYLSATALAAWVVFEKLGLGLLRHAWINVDLLWAIALIGTGVLTVVL
ncbi:MAG: hypothetical protein ACRD44_19765 [Bryobacteraceae bacterium]